MKKVLDKVQGFKFAISFLGIGIAILAMNIRFYFAVITRMDSFADGIKRIEISTIVREKEHDLMKQLLSRLDSDRRRSDSLNKVSNQELKALQEKIENLEASK